MSDFLDTDKNTSMTEFLETGTMKSQIFLNDNDLDIENISEGSDLEIPIEHMKETDEIIQLLDTNFSELFHEEFRIAQSTKISTFENIALLAEICQKNKPTLEEIPQMGSVFCDEETVSLFQKLNKFVNNEKYLKMMDQPQYNFINCISSE